MDEYEKAVAYFDAHKSKLEGLHAHATAQGDTVLAGLVDDMHAEDQQAWTDYLAARGWEQEAATANRSGGEDKPPPPPPPPPGGGGDETGG